MRQRRLNLAALAVNSSLGFALGTVVALQVYQLGLVTTGLVFDREPQWYPDRVEFRATGSDLAWSGGILLVLLLGWALASIYRGGTRYDGTRLAVLWVMLHFFRQGLLALLMVTFDEESDAGLALATSNLPESLTWVVAVLGAAGLLGIGLLAAPALLRFARHAEDLATKRGRLTFIATTGILAWLIGALLTLPLLQPDTGSGVLSMLPWSGVFLLFTLVASSEPRDIDPVREPVRLAWGTLVMLGVLVVASKVFLADGWVVTF
jgi:hypothetical protein